MADVLLNKYNKAYSEGKLLDVSEVKQDGSGTSYMNIPKTGASSKKFIRYGDRPNEYIPIASDNYNSYAWVAEQIFPYIFGADANNAIQMYTQAFYDEYGMGVVNRPAKTQKAKVPSRQAAATPSSHKKRSGQEKAEDLMKLIRASEAKGEYRDVSNMTKTGLNSKSWAYNPDSKKHVVSGLSIASDNATTYKWATDILGPSYSKYYDAYVREYGNIRQKAKAGAKSPGRPKGSVGKKTRGRSPGRPKGSVTKKVGAKSPGRAKQTLAQRYSNKKQGTILDVSHYHEASQKIGTFDPSKVATTSKRGLPGLDIVSSTRDGYWAALLDLGYPHDQAVEYLQMWDQL